MRLLPRSLALCVGATALLATPAYGQATAPSATTGEVSDVAPERATFSGVVDPNGATTRYHFEYGQQGPNNDSRRLNAGSGTAPVPVRITVKGLKPETRYVYRLVAVSAQGTDTGEQRTFTTPAKQPQNPTLQTGKATNISTTGATLNGTINTRGQTGTYQFQYGPTRDYGAATPVAAFGPTTRGTDISSPVDGLAPGTLYHYRLVFQPASGRAVIGADRTFTTDRVPNGLLIEAKPNPVRYGRGVQVGGILAGSGNTGVGITVQADTFPFDGNWRNIASGRTDATGAYLINVSPMLVNSQLRTVAAVRPQVVSPPTTVSVRLAVSLRVNTHPRRGARIRFRGRVSPSQDGAAVSIQRRVRGRYRTIARTRVDGSRYSRRVAIRRTGRYRAFVRSTDGAHISGKRSRFIRVR